MDVCSVSLTILACGASRFRKRQTGAHEAPGSSQMSMMSGWKLRKISRNSGYQCRYHWEVQPKATGPSRPDNTVVAGHQLRLPATGHSSSIDAAPAPEVPSPHIGRDNRLWVSHRHTMHRVPMRRT